MADQSLFDLLGEGDPDTAQGPRTWSVGELHFAIEGVLADTFGDEIWIEGEIRNLKRSAKKHVYFDLVDSDKAGDNYPPMLAVTLFDRDRQSVNRFLREQGGNVKINDGVRVRIRGRLKTYPARSSLQFRMTAIDPKFTLGVLELMRQKVLAALDAEQLLERNSLVALTPVPWRVAMVTSLGSAAHADALHEFQGSGLGIQLFLFDARVQGNSAGGSVAAAVRAADKHGVDLILVVRGGGARTDLAAFDLEVVARSIALSSVPVFTGIGHEVDTSIADQVAHSSFKTPTAAAAAACEVLHLAVSDFEGGWLSVHQRSLRHLERFRTGLGNTAARLGRASSRHLTHRRQSIEHLSHSICFSSSSKLDQAATRLDDQRRRMTLASRRSLELQDHRIAALAAHARAHDPRLALARGWSITRDANGQIVRSVNDLDMGQGISTEFADGTVRSEVHQISPRIGPLASEATPPFEAEPSGEQPTEGHSPDEEPTEGHSPDAQPNDNQPTDNQSGIDSR